VNRLKHIGNVLVVLVILNAAAGCKSTADRIAYNTLDGAVSAVQAGMTGFNAYYQAGKATEEQRLQVLAAYKKFQASVNVAIDVAKLSTTGQIDMRAVSEAAGDLLALIATLKGG